MNEEVMELVNDLIRITRKYYKTSDRDLLDSKFNIQDKLDTLLGKNMKSCHKVELIQNLAKQSQFIGRSYQTIYDAYNIFYPNDNMGMEEE